MADKDKRKKNDLTETILSLQNLLDDVSDESLETAAVSLDRPTAGSSRPQPRSMDDTSEFSTTGSMPGLVEPRRSATDIDSHFDMNIPPALPDDEDAENIPTLSDTIVAGEIPVLKEIVRLPDGSVMQEPPEVSLEEAMSSGSVPTPVGDAAEAAVDAIQIIFNRYHGKTIPVEVREELQQRIIDILKNTPGLDIPDSIL
jgi:hypothetical protein